MQESMRTGLPHIILAGSLRKRLETRWGGRCENEAFGAVPFVKALAMGVFPCELGILLGGKHMPRLY